MRVLTLILYKVDLGLADEKLLNLGRHFPEIPKMLVIFEYIFVEIVSFFNKNETISTLIGAVVDADRHQYTISICAVVV